jgi:hypothetical protein
VYGDNSRWAAKLYKEYAEQLQSRHEEKGRPEYSIWNRSANIKEDDLSADARFYYNKAAIAFRESVNYLNYSFTLHAN